MATETAAEMSLTLTEIEQRLVDHVTRGKLLDLAGREPVDETAMRTWDSTRTIRAVVLRDILRGRLAPNPDPHGLRLRGALIDGRLDLADLTTGVALELRDCLLTRGLVAHRAQLSVLGLSGSRLEHPSQPPLDADLLTATWVDLSQAVITAYCKTGAVRLPGAHLGTLACSNTTIRNDAGAALYADGLQADKSVVLSGGFKASGTGERGAIRLLGARIQGDLNCTDATVRNDSGPALNADRLKVDKSVVLSGGFKASGTGERGAIRLAGAHIQGELNCTDATVRNDSGPALDADYLHVDLTVLLSGVEAIGGVWLRDAHLGMLQCDGATLRNDSGSALIADDIQIDRDALLRDGFEAVGAGESGAVRLAGAHIRELTCRDGTMHNDSGPALYADDLQVDQNVFLRGFELIGAVRLPGAHLGRLESDDTTIRNDAGAALYADVLQVDEGIFLHEFAVVGAGESGAVRLLGARLGMLQCDGATLRNDSGPALVADNLHVDHNVFLSRKFQAVGAGELGAVHLPGAHIQGDLNCTDATVRNDSGPALNANNLHVDHDVLLSGDFEAVGAGSDVTLNLSHVQIGGVLEFAPARLTNTTDSRARLALDGLTYTGLPVSSLDWLHLLRKATPGYAAQPYQQFAAAHRAAGHDGEVRRILMAQRQDQIDRRALTGRMERAWARLTGLTLGYGYQPWRALLALVVVAATAVVLALTLGAHGGVARVNPKPPAASQCSAVERVGVGLDLGLPLIKTGIRTRCDTTASTTGQMLTIAGWGLQLAAWAFATLFIAGFTGAVRKT